MPSILAEGRRAGSARAASGDCAIVAPMVNPMTDPRTEDTLAFDVLRGPIGGESQVVGRATFSKGRTAVTGPEEVRVAVSELLGRAFVDRIEPDERPRGYRRTHRGSVDMLVPGMAEHFVARMRGLWLPYPDGSVVTARPAPSETRPAVLAPASPDAGPPVTAPAVRRATLAQTADLLGKRPIVPGHAPDTGLRPGAPAPAVPGEAGRTDCGWLV